MWGLEAIEAFVSKQIEDKGLEMVLDFVYQTPIGTVYKTAREFSEFIESGGEAELERLASQIGLRPHLPKGEVMHKLKHAVERASSSSQRRKPRWMRGGWAKSRQEWLDEGWRHDWRSQPRDLRGRWIPGRLDYPVMKKYLVSRRQRLARRFRNKYRRIGRSAARGIVSSWNLDGH